jgi:hypothetical protein
MLNFVFSFNEVLLETFQSIDLAIVLLPHLVYIRETAFSYDFKKLKIPNFRLFLEHILSFVYMNM